MDFSDTHMTEPEDEEYYDTSEKILRLSDELSEEIILDNINQQLNGQVDDHTDKINYVRLFREKFEKIDSDSDYYDKDYMAASVDRLGELVSAGLAKRYYILPVRSDYTTPEEYLRTLEVLYEFLYIRQYTNLVDFIERKIDANKELFASKYEAKIQDEEHANDLFVIQSRKKFKNESDIAILHFLNEIIDDICSDTTSAYVLFDEICGIDKFEVYNYEMSEMILNYGAKMTILDDAKAAGLYIAPLLSNTERDSLRSRIWSDYLENCDILEDEIQ